MSQDFQVPTGTVVDSVDLALFKSSDIARFLAGNEHPFVTLIECRRRDDGAETIVMDIGVERPQHVRHDIRHVERIAATFFPKDDQYPDVLAMRADFPKGMPHLNIRHQGSPASLCLYEEPYEEVKLVWTPKRYVERIRRWLADTSRGELHREDQAVEPFLLPGIGRIVLPTEVFEGDFNDELLLVALRPEEDTATLFAYRDGDMMPFKQDAKPAILFTLSSLPLSDGRIRNSPNDLQDLQVSLAEAGIDLLSWLRQALTRWCLDGVHKDKRGLEPIILVRFPLKRRDDGPVERVELWAFHVQATVDDLGKAIGAWASHGSHTALILGAQNASDLKAIEVASLNPVRRFSRREARFQNGLPLVDVEPRLTIVGVGALGSMIHNALSRAGFGRLTSVDSDIMLPHNLARHELDAYSLGFSKAKVMAMMAKSLLGDEAESKGIHDDVIRPRRHVGEVTSAFADSDITIDCSASVAVERHIASQGAECSRIISVFIAPNGTDLVVLAEDSDKKIPIDCIEHEYYRYVRSNEALGEHMRPQGQLLRYAASCRDVSVSLPHDVVSIHAAIASARIKRLDKTLEASIEIWRISSSCEVERFVSQVPAYRLIDHGSGWRVRLSDSVLVSMEAFRRTKAPAETGGILLGSFDVSRKIVYVADLLGSPSDSVERPESYIRGVAGLTDLVKKTEDVTADRLTYVGEWHSHGNLDSSEPSGDDLAALSKLGTILGEEGLPAVMLIKSTNSFSVLVNDARI